MNNDQKLRLWIKLMNIGHDIWGCHQIEKRSFFFKGYQFPICARCTGLLVGYFVACIACIWDIIPEWYWCFCLLLPMAVDGIVQLKTKYESNNLKRVITGCIAGYGFIGLIYNIIHSIIHL